MNSLNCPDVLYHALLYNAYLACKAPNPQNGIVPCPRSHVRYRRLWSDNTEAVFRRCCRSLEGLFAAVRTLFDSWHISHRGKLTLSHSSHALPAPKPRPTNAGHARRLNRRTEKTTPNETPRPERMSIEERQRSHCRYVLAGLSEIDSLPLICLLYRDRAGGHVSRVRVLCPAITRNHLLSPSAQTLQIESNYGQCLITGLSWEWLYLFVEQSFAHGACGPRDVRNGLGVVFGHGSGYFECN